MENFQQLTNKDKENKVPKIKLTQEHLDQAATIYEHGWYTLRVDDLVETTDSKKADLYRYVCKIIDSDDEDNKRYVGKKAFIQVSENGLGFAIPFFRACGAEIPEKIEGELPIELKFCVGKTFKAQNNPGLDKNKVMRNNWNVFARMD
jgi:hypothetical protein